MKISQVTIQDLKSYVLVTHSEDDPLFTSILTAGKQYIQSYTGLSSESMDLKEDLTMALFVICTELYDNRAYTVESDKINPFIRSVLQMHSINLL